MLDVRPLFEALDNELILFSRSLKPADWNRTTSVKNWSIKKIFSHLLDGNCRALSIQRDRYFADTPPPDANYEQIVDWLNEMNADWILATNRLSPQVLLLLHELTGPLVNKYYNSLDLQGEAIFPVHWAGESTSKNWMHLAREYTEKWHHQQQMRAALNDPTLYKPTFFEPYLHASLLGLPHIFKSVHSDTGTCIKIIIEGMNSHIWYLIRDSTEWNLVNTAGRKIVAEVTLPADISWKLFSGNVGPEQIKHQVEIKGDHELGEKVLSLVAVMA